LGVASDLMDAKPYMVIVPQGHVWAEGDSDALSSKLLFHGQDYLVTL